MMVSTVKGRFEKLQGTIEIDEEQPEHSSVRAEIETASVNTGVAQRDDHLRSDDFFNAERFPLISFRSTGVERVSDGDWRIAGDLTIRDITRPVVLDTEFEGQGLDAYGGYRAGFIATTQLNRKDFGLNWNGLIETGGVVVADKVKLTLNIEAIRKN